MIRTSVSLYLCVCFPKRYWNHRGTENTEKKGDFPGKASSPLAFSPVALGLLFIIQD